MTSRLRAAGLFAGVGGFELGFRAAGFATALLCEKDPAAREVLRCRFPGVPLKRDIEELENLPREVDLVAAGFPCQDLSQAGTTRGLRGRNSSLVREVFRLLTNRRVEWVLLENVPFMLRLGGGAALRRIVRNLERLDYSWTYRVVDTRAFGLPQRRKRVFLLASQSYDPRSVLLADDVGVPDDTPSLASSAYGFYWTEGNRGLGWAIDAVPTLKGGSDWGIPSPPAIMLPDGRIVTPDIRDAERLQGFPADWTRPALKFSKPGHRWKLIGNAVSVPVARWIAQRLANPVSFGGDGVKLREGDGWPDVAWNVGEGRFMGEVSSWPKRYTSKPLASFLRFEPKALSTKAASGFLSRILRSQLTRPDGLVRNLTAHLQRAGNGHQP